MERDEDGVVLGSTRLLGSQRLHQSGDATRAAESPVEPMTAPDSPSAISVFRINIVPSLDLYHTAGVTSNFHLILLNALLLGGLTSCGSSGAPTQQPMSEGMAARILSRDMNKRSSFESAMVSQNSGMGSYLEKQGYQAKSYQQTQDFTQPKNLKQKDFSRANQSNPLGSKNFNQTDKANGFTRDNFATTTAREASQIASQQGRTYNGASKSFRTRSVSDAAKSQAENKRPIIVKPDGPISDGAAYTEDEIRSLINRN
jgi:hypothetical protein